MLARIAYPALVLALRRLVPELPVLGLSSSGAAHPVGAAKVCSDGDPPESGGLNAAPRSTSRRTALTTRDPIPRPLTIDSPRAPAVTGSEKVDNRHQGASLVIVGGRHQARRASCASRTFGRTVVYLAGASLWRTATYGVRRDVEGAVPDNSATARLRPQATGQAHDRHGAAAPLLGRL